MNKIHEELYMGLQNTIDNGDVPVPYDFEYIKNVAQNSPPPCTTPFCKTLRRTQSADSILISENKSFYQPDKYVF